MTKAATKTKPKTKSTKSKTKPVKKSTPAKKRKTQAPKKKQVKPVRRATQRRAQPRTRAPKTSEFEKYMIHRALYDSMFPEKSPFRSIGVGTQAQADATSQTIPDGFGTQTD